MELQWEDVRPEIRQEVQIKEARRIIIRRAVRAGMEFDLDDIKVAWDNNGLATVFLLRNKTPVYDEENGEYGGWEYKYLIWVEYGPNPFYAIEEQNYTFAQYQPNIRMLCPWLVCQVMSDGTMKWADDGNVMVMGFSRKNNA